MKRSLSSLIENTDVREFKVVDIEVEKISESKTQARTYFDEKKLSELSESIKTVSYTHLTLPTKRIV